MGSKLDFLKIKRKEKEARPIKVRANDYNEIYLTPKEEDISEQSQRCMECGTPFCHFSCPLGNYCVEWHDFIRNGNWEQAFAVLEETNNFPEFTGRLCPALCEGGCVLGINDSPVTNKNVELFLAEKAWQEGWIKPQPPKSRTDKKIAIIGSGPTGLAAAQELNRAGHHVVVFEKDDQIGGMLRYGIPDFKIEPEIIQRRVKQLEAEGVEFCLSTEVGVDYSITELEDEFTKIILAVGARKARDLPIAGNNLQGIYYAMDFLTEQNKALTQGEEPEITAQDKNVLVIGGGDTGADCVGTAVRQGAKEVYQIELLEKPPEDRSADNPWPEYPQTLKVNSSHKEAEKLTGQEMDQFRMWSVLSKEFIGDENGNVKKYRAKKIEWVKDETGEQKMKELDTEIELDVDMVIIAIGFTGSKEESLIEELNIKTDSGRIETNQYQTSNSQVFAAGDVRKGPSLIVWAIQEGRKVAQIINQNLV